MARVIRFALNGQRDYTESEDGTIEITEKYLASTDVVSGAFAAIRKHRPNLQRWQPHRDFPDVVVRRCQITQRRTLPVFDVTVEYSTQTQDEDEQDPTQQPATVDVSTQKIDVVTFRKPNGDFYLNTAGQLLEGKTTKLSLPVFSISKNLASVPSWLLQYDEACNSDTVILCGQVCAPRTLKVESLQVAGNPQRVGDFEYYPMQLQLIHNRQTWDEFDLNRGTLEVGFDVITKPVKGSDKPRKFVVRKLLPIKDKSGMHDIAEPVFLDREGRRPRVLASDKTKSVTLAEEIEAALKGKPIATVVKEPLAKEDIVVLRSEPRLLPFSVFPLR